MGGTRGDVPRDVTGRAYGRLTALRCVGFKSYPSGRRSALWLCQCSCGKEKTLSLNELHNTRSCGCLIGDAIRARRGTHLQSNTPLYAIWRGMLDRCNNRNSPAFDDYGGRGIKVCDRWRGREGFKNFSADMGARPSKTHSIERRGNDAGYSPDNCYWGTRLEQANNKRSNRKITHRGETHSINEWSRITGLNRRTITERLNRGWGAARTLDTPPLHPPTNPLCKRA